LGGVWSKWYIMLGAADTGQILMIGVLMISSLLNVAYLLPVVARGFFLKPAGTNNSAVIAIKEAPFWCVVPLCVTAIGCFVLFFYAGDIYTLIEPVAFPEGARLP